MKEKDALLALFGANQHYNIVIGRFEIEYFEEQFIVREYHERRTLTNYFTEYRFDNYEDAIEKFLEIKIA